MTHISADSPAAIQPIGVSASGATGEAIEASRIARLFRTRCS